MNSKDSLLLDSWKAEGTDFETFRKEMERMDEDTVVYKEHTTNLTLMTLYGAEDDGSPDCVFWDDEALERANYQLALPVPVNLNVKSHALLDESMDDNGSQVMIRLKQAENGLANDVFLSANALNTLGKQAGVAGERIRRATVTRDMYLAEGLNDTDTTKECTMIVRYENGVGKIFSVLGDSYEPTPMVYLSRVAEALLKGSPLGKAEIRDWHVDNRIAEIRLEFPEAREKYRSQFNLPDTVYPGILLTSSATGDSSLKAIQTIRFGSKDATCFADNRSRRHISQIQYSQYWGDVQTVLKTTGSFMTRLAGHMMAPVYGGASCTLNDQVSIDELINKEMARGNKNGQTSIDELIEKEMARESKNAMKDLFTEVLNGSGIGPLLGKARKRDVITAVMNELTGNEVLTEYDVYLRLLAGLSIYWDDVPERAKDQIQYLIGRMYRLDVKRLRKEARV